MTPLMNALSCLLALCSAVFLWENRKSVLKESISIAVFLVLAEVYMYFSGNLADVTMEHYPLRMLALCLCFSATGLPQKRRRYLVLFQLLWLWVELFGGIALFYRGFDIPWTRILAIAGLAFGSTFLSRITREMEFCLMVYWIAIWVFF